MKLIDFMHNYPHLVPDEPPSKLQVTPTSPWSVMTSWSPVPNGHENGVVIGYKINGVSLNDSSSLKAILRFPATKRMAYISGLDQETAYCFQVLAFTRKGDGVSSSCVVVVTPRQGMHT